MNDIEVSPASPREDSSRRHRPPQRKERTALSGTTFQRGRRRPARPQTHTSPSVGWMETVLYTEGRTAPTLQRAWSWTPMATSSGGDPT